VPYYATDGGAVKMSIHALLMDTPSTKIIVDTCIGNNKERMMPEWNQLAGNFLDKLSEQGWPRETIDAVLCTHLHVDHVGWNTMRVDGKWVPTFPNARYLIANSEWAHWQSGAGDKYGEAFDDSVKPVFNAGLVDLVECDATICDEVTLVPTPGHTPGHVSVRIRSKGQEAYITGDALHHPCQMARLDWSSAADNDATMARDTRIEMLSGLADTDTLVFGTHFATPSAGHVKREADGSFRFEVNDGS
jgi:glyoxylase-like metal-dependent hydrolase (beta-lactamase superfamily II)